MQKINMDSLVEVLRTVEASGFQIQFEVEAAGLREVGSAKSYQPHEIKIVHFYRFEGESSPEDSSILYAIETNDKIKGTLVDGYGMASDAQTGDFMRQVESIRK